MFSKRLKGVVSKDFSGGLQAPMPYIRLEFLCYFPNTFHLYIRSYIHGTIQVYLPISSMRNGQLFRVKLAKQ